MEDWGRRLEAYARNLPRPVHDAQRHLIAPPKRILTRFMSPLIVSGEHEQEYGQTVGDCEQAAWNKFETLHESASKF